MTVHAVFKKYNAARAMRIRVSQEDPMYPYETYFQNAERVVNVTFPDKDRRKVVAPGIWKTQLLPIQLLFFTFVAENTLKAWSTPSGMNLTVLDLVLSGVPDSLDLNNKLRFDLKGQLRVKRDVPGQAKLVLDGIVAMELEADVPPIIAANPGIDQLCQTILDRILEKLERSLVEGVVADYDSWLSEVRVQTPRVEAVPSAVSMSKR
eukprot:CAMPEP_0198200440 /NCGR_PEP_ID=MMETSP1445-20131203/3450_1 /TAXON_ID=36898 /ORGANISM="Pyramimonas sp., Strain CCMP2087" /LENGTH=206 /DNA_ID=CAMNT_0043870511 /DNA_START=463 /DNA_END=1083 /DNA_ORIENTATION=-